MTAAIALPLVVKERNPSSAQMTATKMACGRVASSTAACAMTGRLPESILREMLGFFSVQELLVLEQVDGTWKELINSSGAWSAIELRHEQRTDELADILCAIAYHHGSEVRRLELINCAVADEILVEIGRYFDALNVFAVSGCKALTDNGFEAVVSASRASIIEVRAVRCPMLADSSVETLNKFHGATIEHVDFSHCRMITPAGVAALVEGTTRLQKLGLKGCPKVDDSAVASIASNCHRLQSLLLGGSGNVTDTTLEALGNNCPALEKLDIARSNPFGMSRGGVSDQGLLRLLSKCSSLRHLVLRGQGRLSPLSLSALPQFCPQLQSLDIGGCRGIVQDPVVLCNLLRRVACLEHLNVSFCRGVVEDQHLSSIMSECRALKRFEVDGETIVPVASA